MKLDNFDFNPVEDKELGLNDYVVDALAAPVRGLEGLARSAYDLGDFLAFDHLPDLDEQRIFGRSATMPGMIIEGITQFAVPFGAIGAGVKVAGAAARVGKLGGVAGKTAKALTKTRKKLSFKGDMAVGAAADFVAFDAQEHRLSNLIQQFPELQNPVSEYLAASPDDTEALGRAKNAIEGLILGGVIGTVGAVTAPVFRTFIAGLDAIKTRNTELEKGATREDATITALMQHQDATKDIRLDEEFAFERRKDAEEFDEIFRAAGGDPEEIPQIDLRTINWDSLEVEELLESTPTMAREEAEAIQAGGVLFFQDETAKTIVKHYQMPNGSRKTILLDINDPSRVYDATNYVERLAEESARGAPGVKAADLDKEFGGINESMKQDFYQKTLVEEVGKRMDSDAPMTVRQALEDIQGRTGGLLNKYAPIVKKLLALGEDTGIDAKLEIRSKAKDLPTTGIRGSFYDSKNRRVVIDAEASSVKNNPVYNILHEATHAVTVDNAVKHYDRAAFNAVDVDNIKGRAAIVDAALNQKDVPKPVAEMLRMFKKADAMRDEIAAKGKLVGTDGKPDLYWIKNPAEFMSFAFTDPQLQQALKGIQYTPKMTMWQKLLNTVKSLFGRGVSTDLMDNIVSRVGEIAEMKLPTQKGRGVDMMPEALHATPHIFKPKPDSPYGAFQKSKIGTGEGAQSFGHGFYVTESEGIAKHYYRQLLFDHISRDLDEVTDDLVGSMLDPMNFLDFREVFDTLDEVIETGTSGSAKNSAFRLSEQKREFLKLVREDDYLGFDNPIEGIRQAIVDSEGSGPGRFGLSPATRKAAKNLGRIYKIDVAPSEDKFLSWDKPISDLPKELQKKLRSVVETVQEYDPELLSRAVKVPGFYQKNPSQLSEFLMGVTGQELYKALGRSKVIGSPEAASDLLSEMGVPGIRYLAGGKPRKTGEGAHNYVVFNAKDLKVKGTVEFLPEGVERGVPVDDKLIDNIVKEIDFSTFKVGGAQSVSGVLKSLGKLKLPDGMLMSDLINIQEKLSDRILKEAQKQPKLAQALLDEGVVNEMADAVGADGKFFEGIIAATKKDPTQLMRIASRMKTLEHMLTSNGAQIIDIAKKYKEGRKTLGEEELEILEAQLKGALEQQLVIQSNHSSIASGFGKGLKSRQMNVKMSLSPNELSDAKLRQEYLQRRGGMTTDQMVESILLASDGKGDSMWNAIISMNKLIRGSEGGKMMNMIEEYYKNSIMSAPSSLTLNFMGPGIAAGIKNFERYVGGWLGQPPEVRQAVVNSWAQATKYQDLWKFMLKAWKSGDRYIGESGSAFVEQTAKGTLGSITGKNIETSINRAREFTGRGTTELSDATKGFIDYFGNLIRVPNRFNSTSDQMYKFMEYRMRAHANLWIKATDMGLKDPKDIAEYIDKSLNVLLTRSNRTFSKANLIREAEAQFKNLPPVEREKAVHDYVRNAETEAVGKARELGLVGQEGEEFQALQHLARDWVDPNISSADDLTFSKQLGPKMQKVQDIVSGIPFGFVVAPFIRTPTNILKFSFARTLAPAAALKDATMLAISPAYRQRIEALSNGQPGLENLRNSLLEQMKAVNPDGSPDLIARAEARGKLATGTLLNTVLASVVYFQGDRVTGGGPKDFKQRQAWSAAGNMPYSVKIGDKWISYQRLDPVATMIGVYADFKDLMEDGKMHSVDASDFEKFAAASTLVLTRNATNKSYLTGIDKFFSMIFDPDSTSAGETAGSMVGGFVPNILSKGQSITGDQELKEIRGFADAILKRFPGTNLDLKRNPLGEPVVQEYFEGVAGILNPANPMIWGSAKDDPVLLELANVGHGFSAPSTKLEGILDLTDFQGSNKRSAYDRWLELQGEVKINNKTLRQTLLKLIKSKGYQSLSDETYSGLPSPRVEYISKVLSRFRSRAKMQMLDEFPEIKEQLRRVKTAKKGLKGGMQGEDVLALLAQ